jgi:hypothetical protein
LDTRPEKIDDVLAQPPWQHKAREAQSKPTRSKPSGWSRVAQALNLRILPIWVVLVLGVAAVVILLARR